MLGKDHTIKQRDEVSVGLNAAINELNDRVKRHHKSLTILSGSLNITHKKLNDALKLINEVDKKKDQLELDFHKHSGTFQKGQM